MADDNRNQGNQQGMSDQNQNAGQDQQSNTDQNPQDGRQWDNYQTRTLSSNQEGGEMKASDIVDLSGEENSSEDENR